MSAADYDEWLSLFANRNEVADEYANLLAVYVEDPGFDWSAVNHAILRRWSIAALRYIKARAWKLEEARRADVRREWRENRAG